MAKISIAGLLALCICMAAVPGARSGEVYFIPVDESAVTISEALPDSSFTGMTELGMRSYLAHNSRVVMRLNLASFTPPVGGVLDTAEVGMYVIRNVTGASASCEIDGYALTTAYDVTVATWRYPWSSPGGDYDTTMHVSAVIAGTHCGWIVWDVTELLREKWDDVANGGMLFRYHEENLAPPGASCWFTPGGLKGTSPYVRLIYDFPSGVNDHVDDEKAEKVRLHNAPNPFNTATKITFVSERRQRCELSIYNLLGQCLAVLYDGPASPGEHVVYWNAVDDVGHDVPTGIYFCRFRTDNDSVVRRLLLLK
ncbi:MAG: T9SS type A sorting domain-containing protein [candidate division Zixibacteria bacterium]|nr:T9SS type A sorting domain-containing protein [candidate division Zixibacteria bacterium]